MKTLDSESSGVDWVPTILWGIIDARGGMTSLQEQLSMP